MSTDPNAPPLNPLPPVVWALALPMILAEAAFGLAARGIIGGAAGDGWRLDAVQRFAFSPDLLRYFQATAQWPLDGLHRFLTYPFVHLSITQALFAVVILLALGKMVGEVFRWWGVLAVFFGAAAGGALIYTLVLPGVAVPLVGAFPAVYGLIGAFTFLLWVRAAATGSSQARAFTLIGVLMGVQLLFGVLFGGGSEWVADLAGFAIGFALSLLCAPGAWGRVRDRLRSR
jgi:membrane associated rhomboid family serine protease